MNHTIRKPHILANPDHEEGVWKYLADVVVGDAALNSCRVRVGKVVGIYDSTHVNIELDGAEYQNIPVWIHTDEGARSYVYREEALQEPLEELDDAEGYFKNSALMFPLPGCVPLNDSWTDKITTFNDEGSGAVSFDSNLFTFTTALDRDYDCALVQSVQESTVILKPSAYSIDASTGQITIAGETLEEEEYTVIGDDVLVFATSVTYDGSHEIPIECVDAITDDKVFPCSTVLAKYASYDDTDTIEWVKLATDISSTPLVYVVCSQPETEEAEVVAVIGIKSTSPAVEDGNGFPTYRLVAWISATNNQLGGSSGVSGLTLEKSALYDLLTGEVLQIPSLDDDGNKTLPFISSENTICKGVNGEDTSIIYTISEDEQAVADAVTAYLEKGIFISDILQETSETGVFGCNVPSFSKYASYAWNSSAACNDVSAALGGVAEFDYLQKNYVASYSEDAGGVIRYALYRSYPRGSFYDDYIYNGSNFYIVYKGVTYEQFINSYPFTLDFYFPGKGSKEDNGISISGAGTVNKVTSVDVAAERYYGETLVYSNGLEVTIRTAFSGSFSMTPNPGATADMTRTFPHFVEVRDVDGIEVFEAYTDNDVTHAYSTGDSIEYKAHYHTQKRVFFAVERPNYICWPQIAGAFLSHTDRITEGVYDDSATTSRTPVETVWAGREAYNSRAFVQSSIVVDKLTEFHQDVLTDSRITSVEEDSAYTFKYSTEISLQFSLYLIPYDLELVLLQEEATT